MSEEALFHEALAIAPAERAAFLDAACLNQPALRQAVEALLAAHAASASLLDQPAVDPNLTGAYTPPPVESTGVHVPQEAQPGYVIAGRYTLEQKIGEGGMGEVWVAKQTEPVKRKVALKLIKAGMDSKAVLQRFEAERQALALMDHPHIAKVLDGGLTQDRHPFFVMELVNGLPLNKFCDEAKLTPKERLELFVPICQAVQHAHQKGIVHRDLKPGNILVTLIDGKPVPKVIDFGVAKAMVGKLTDDSLSTNFGAVVGTLEYMSPEQAGYSGADIDTRADIYSLGVILYEMLTGLRPIDAKRLHKAALTEMIRIIREEEPSKPSTRLSTDESLPSLAAVRQTEPKKLMALLRGELDWVVMKCLEKQRDRRYETANGLARDIQRYLADEPVEARPPSFSYWAGKFLRRHKGPVLAATLVVLALLAGITGTTWGLFAANRAAEAERLARQEADHKRAEAERERVRAEAGEKLADERRVQVEAEKKVAVAVRGFLQNKLLSQADVTVQAFALLHNQAVPAGVKTKINPTIRELLDRAAAELSAANVEVNFPQQPLLQAELLLTVGDAYRGIGEPGKAIDFLRRAVAIRRQLQGAGHPDTLQGLFVLAWAYKEAGQLEPAVALMEETLQLRKTTLGPEHTETLSSRNDLAATYLQAGKRDLALPLAEETLKVARATLGPEHPYTLGFMHTLAEVYRAAGKLALALPLAQETLRLRQAKFGSENPYTLGSMNTLVSLYLDLGKPDLALPLAAETFTLTKKIFGPDHPDVLASLQGLIVAYERAGKKNLALPLYAERLRLTKAKFGSQHYNTLICMNNLAKAYAEAGKLELALPLYEETLKLTKATLGPQHPDTLQSMNSLGAAYLTAGRRDLALPLLEEALNVRKAKLGPEHHDTLESMNNLAAMYWQERRLDKSIPLFEETLKVRERKFGRGHPGTLMVVANLGVNYRDAGRLAEAIPLLEEAYRASRKDPALRFTSFSLLDGYAQAGKQEPALGLAKTLVTESRNAWPKDSPQLALELTVVGQSLLQTKAFAEAESLLREALTIREKTQPDAWPTFNTQSLLGGALLSQKKYTEAEPLLRKGYEGMKQREKTIPPQGKIRLTEALERLVQLYEALGKPEEAAKWRKELVATKAAQGKPEKKP